jgi:hypothetical protein
VIEQFGVAVAQTPTCCAKGSSSVEVIEQFGVAVAQTPTCCAKGSASVEVLRTVWCCCCTDSQLLCQRELICKHSTSDSCFSRSSFAGAHEHEQNYIVLFGPKVTLQAVCWQ